MTKLRKLNRPTGHRISMLRVPFVLPGVLLPLCEGMMSFTNYLQSWLTDTKIGQEDIQEYFELV
ncbi:hypothetical protein Lser_V15G21265 [Lactuca serriola]